MHDGIPGYILVNGRKTFPRAVLYVPLPEGFVGALVQRDVQARLSDEEDHRKVPGIHFKVEHDLEVGQDLMAEHVRLVNDDHGSDPFFKGVPFDLPLDVIEKVILPEARFRTEPERKLPVEIHNGQRGKAAVRNLEQGGVQGSRPKPCRGGLSPPGFSRKDAKAPGVTEIVQPHPGLGSFRCLQQDIFAFFRKGSNSSPYFAA